jgi:predicted TIM-barrel fold metal-dependent hydrolase
VINPRTGKNASKELARCFKAGLRGLKLWPWGDFNPNAEYVYPLAEACEKFHAPLAMHTDPLDPRCHPLVLADLATEFRRVTFIHAHMTDPLSSLQMIRAASKCKNIILETSVCSSVSYIEDAIREIGPRRVVWGTDWPFFNAFEIELAKMEVLNASQEEKRLVMGANICRILKLEGLS